jgi:hypothetical protein
MIWELVAIGLLTVRSSYSDCVGVVCNLSVFRASRHASISCNVFRARINFMFVYF